MDVTLRGRPPWTRRCSTRSQQCPFLDGSHLWVTGVRAPTRRSRGRLCEHMAPRDPRGGQGDRLCRRGNGADGHQAASRGRELGRSTWRVGHHGGTGVPRERRRLVHQRPVRAPVPTPQGSCPGPHLMVGGHCCPAGVHSARLSHVIFIKPDAFCRFRVHTGVAASSWVSRGSVIVRMQAVSNACWR